MRLPFRTLAPIAAGVSAGILIGWLIGSWASPEMPGPNEVSRAPGTAEVSGDHPGITERSEAETAPRATEASAPEAPADFDAILADLEDSGRRVVPRKLLRHAAGYGVVTRYGSLSTHIAEMLQLDSSEIARLNEIIQQTAERLADLDLDRLEIERPSEEKVVFKIGAYPDAAAEAMADLQQAFHATLGQRRGAFLWEMMSGYDVYWAGFGKEAMEVEFSLIPGDDAYWRISRMDPDAAELRGRTAFRQRGTMPPGRYAYLVPMLPPELGTLFQSTRE